MRIYLAVGIVWLVAASVALGDEPGKPCEKCGQAAGKVEGNAKKGPYPAPWACPLFEVMALGDGNLYYCDYFTTEDCSDEPQAVYEFGDFPFPTSCATNDCISARDKGSAGPFTGLDFPVAQGYVHVMPSGRAREYSRVCIDPTLSFIKCDAEGEVFAKVFMIAMDLKGARAGIPTHQFTRSIYVAFQVSGKPDAFETITVCKPVGQSSGGKNFVFQATYSANATQKFPILVFKTK